MKKPNVSVSDLEEHSGEIGVLRLHEYDTESYAGKDVVRLALTEKGSPFAIEVVLCDLPIGCERLHKRF